MIKRHQRNNCWFLSIYHLTLLHSCTLRVFLEHSSIHLDLEEDKQGSKGKAKESKESQEDSWINSYNKVTL